MGPIPTRSVATLHSAMPGQPCRRSPQGAGLEGAIYAGLEELTNRCLGREWHRDDGAGMRIERCLIDANWGSSTDVVYQFCRQSAHSALLLPSHGRFVGASSIPFSEYKRKMGDRVGLNWRIPNVQGKRAVRHVVFDTNYWKSFCPRPAGSGDGRPRLPIALRRQARSASPCRRAHHGRVPCEDRGPRPYR